MHRFRHMLVATSLLGFVVAGCGEDQPNPSAKPEEVTAEFGKSSGDMMKQANSGMDPKKIKSANVSGDAQTPPATK